MAMGRWVPCIFGFFFLGPPLNSRYGIFFLHPRALLPQTYPRCIPWGYSVNHPVSKSQLSQNAVNSEKQTVFRPSASKASPTLDIHLITLLDSCCRIGRAGLLVPLISSPTQKLNLHLHAQLVLFFKFFFFLPATQWLKRCLTIDRLPPTLAK